MRMIDADTLREDILNDNTFDNDTINYYLSMIDGMETVSNSLDEIRLLKNYLSHMPKVYGQRNYNWCVVRDLIMSGTSHAGMTSCIMKCHELGIDPYRYDLKGAVKNE